MHKSSLRSLNEFCILYLYAKVEVFDCVDGIERQFQNLKDQNHTTQQLRMVNYFLFSKITIQSKSPKFWILYLKWIIQQIYFVVSLRLKSVHKTETGTQFQLEIVKMQIHKFLKFMYFRKHGKFRWYSKTFHHQNFKTC